MPNIGFDKKLYIGSFGIIFLTMLIIAVVNFYQSKSSFLSKGETSIQNVSDVLLKTVQLKYNLQKEKIESDMGALVTESQSAGKVMVVKARTIDLDIYDINSGEKEKKTLPKMIFGLEFVTGSNVIVDKVGKFSTSDIAVYQLHEDKLIKVSSSAINKDDSRSIGEYYTSGTDIYKSIMEQKNVMILTKTGSEISMQHMQAFTETLEGKVSGAYSITSKILTSDLVDLAKKVNVGGHGYSYVSGANGKILVHPDKEYISMNVTEFKNGKEMVTAKSGAATYSSSHMN